MDILNIDPKVLILQIGAFAILLIVFKVWLFKPVLGIIDARKSEIENDYAAAEGKLKTAENLKNRYESELAAVKERVAEKMSEAEAEAEALKKQIIDDSRREAAAITEKAMAEIAEEKEAAIRAVKSDMAQLAVDAAGKVIRANMDTETNKKLVADFIAGLDGKE